MVCARWSEKPQENVQSVSLRPCGCDAQNIVHSFVASQCLLIVKRIRQRNQEKVSKLRIMLGKTKWLSCRSFKPEIVGFKSHPQCQRDHDTYFDVKWEYPSGDRLQSTRMEQFNHMCKAARVGSSPTSHNSQSFSSARLEQSAHNRQVQGSSP